MATVRCTHQEPCASGCTCRHVRSHAGSANGSYPPGGSRQRQSPAATRSATHGPSGSPRSIEGRRSPRRRSPAAPRRAPRPARPLGATAIRPTPGGAGRRWRSTARTTHRRTRRREAHAAAVATATPANAATITAAGSCRSTDANRSWARAPSTVVMATTVATASAVSAASRLPRPSPTALGPGPPRAHCAHERGGVVSVFPASHHRASPLGGDPVFRTVRDQDHNEEDTMNGPSRHRSAGVIAGVALLAMGGTGLTVHVADKTGSDTITLHLATVDGDVNPSGMFNAQQESSSQSRIGVRRPTPGRRDDERTATERRTPSRGWSN